MVDFSRATSGVVLPPELSNDIWQGVQETSAVATLATPIRLPGSGVTIPIITSDPTPTWVGETAKKTVSRGTVSSKQMTPYKMAVIVPFSDEFGRDLPSLYNEMLKRLPGAIAAKIDASIFNGTAPGSNFDVLSGAAAVDIAGTGVSAYDNLVDVEAAIADSGGALNGFALSARGVAAFRKVKDADNRPLLASLDGGLSDVLGYRAVRSKATYLNPATGPDVVGFAGDWTGASFGTVEGIKIDVNNSATLDDNGTLLHLWQQNMFAVMCEIEVGFRVRDLAYFRKLTGAVTA